MDGRECEKRARPLPGERRSQPGIPGEDSACAFLARACPIVPPRAALEPGPLGRGASPGYPRAVTRGEAHEILGTDDGESVDAIRRAYLRAVKAHREAALGDAELLARIDAFVGQEAAHGFAAMVPIDPRGAAERPEAE